MAFEECGSQDGFWREIDSMSMCETRHQQQTVPVPQLSPLSDIYSTPGSSASTSGSSKRKKETEDNENSFQEFLKSILSKLTNENKFDGVDNFFLSIAEIVKKKDLSLSQLSHFQCKVMSFVVEELDKI